MRFLKVEKSVLIGLEMPPSMAQWFACCQCSRETDTSVWGDFCPDCNHQQCDSCKVVYPGAPVRGTSFQGPFPYHELSSLQEIGEESSLERNNIGSTSTVLENDGDCDCGSGCDCECSCHDPPPPPPPPREEEHN
jgi:hypothetical protein